MIHQSHLLGLGREYCMLSPQFEKTCLTYLQHCDAVLGRFGNFIDQWNTSISASYSPVAVIGLTVLGLVVLQWVWRVCCDLVRFWQDTGSWRRVVVMVLADLPIIKGVVRREQEKVISKLRYDMRAAREEKKVEVFERLPEEGMRQKRTLMDIVEGRRKMLGDTLSKDCKKLDSKASGAIYIGDGNLLDMLGEVYGHFSLSNPMHADMFPTNRQMEAEVIQMTAGMVGSDRLENSTICGSMTSGGTESILTAMKTSRDYMMHLKGHIKHPEMIIGASAHAAFIKAAEYFKIRLVKAPLDKHHRLTAKAVRKCISRNTIVVVASAPGYPHGILDDVAGIGAVCQKYSVMLHVDACLGGFVLPFLKKMNPERPLLFDFADVPAVTSMSLDTHKFGCSHKGTSVVLYRSPEIRKYQYTSVTDWSGGLYISPGFAGSRNGALIATAWAAMLYHGVNGYVSNAQRMIKCSSILIDAIRNEMPELEIVGEPVMSVVAFTTTASSGCNIYVLNDLLSAKGWKMSALQSPPALHMCFTPAHSEKLAQQLVQDLKESIATLVSSENKDSDHGMAPLYGMAAKVPDRRIVGNFLIAYQDILLEP